MAVELAIVGRAGKRRIPFAAALALPLLALLAGCEPQPPTDANDVYDYVRNGVAGADVRRLDSGAQAYVDRIFHAYRMWEDGCATVESVADLSKLMAKTSHEWRDTTAIAKQLAAIENWIADGSEPSDEQHKTRAEWYQEMLAAIDDVPELPGGTSCRKGDLRTAIANELGVPDRRDWLTSVAGSYKRLMSLATANSEGFSASSQGLTFDAAAVTKLAESAWEATHAALQSVREAELRDIEETLTTGREKRERAIQDKRELREVAESTLDIRRKLRELDLLVRYYDVRIRWAEGRKKELEPAGSGG